MPDPAPFLRGHLAECSRECVAPWIVRCNALCERVRHQYCSVEHEFQGTVFFFAYMVLESNHIHVVRGTERNRMKDVSLVKIKRTPRELASEAASEFDTRAHSGHYFPKHFQQPRSQNEQ